MSKAQDWIIKAVATVLIGALVGGALAWAQSTSQEQDRITTKVAVQETEMRTVKEDITEIKETQRRMESKLDRALERR